MEMENKHIYCRHKFLGLLLKIVTMAKPPIFNITNEEYYFHF